MGTRSKWQWAVGGGAVAATLVVAATAWACMDYRPRPAGLVKDAVSEDAANARAAVEKLRAMGREGLGALMSAYDLQIRGHTGARRSAYPACSPATFRLACSADRGTIDEVPEGIATYPPPPDPAAWKRLSAAIDAVAAQKDAAYSGLYWYTDFEQAKAVARATGKPILSLRLLGKLDEEFSCANSRFFRTVLYANADVSAAMRERFVLHWQSVRPVPKVTIDMGDGRVIERTVTGNSIHYVLDADGRPVDAIPGLYGPRSFLRAITDAAGAVQAIATLTEEDARRTYLAKWHAERATTAIDQFNRDLLAVNVVTRSSAVAPEAWAALASLPQHREDAVLDDGSRTLVRAKNPTSREAGKRAMTKAVVEDPLARVLGNLQRSVALDTVHNEYELHVRVHEWFAGRARETLAADVAPLNEKVYAELFLTPSSDPWLGLVPKDAYSALEGDGVVSARAK